MPNPSPNTRPGGVSPLDTLARLIDLYDGCARAGILSDLGRADRANLERLRRVWAAMPSAGTLNTAALSLRLTAKDYLDGGDDESAACDIAHAQALDKLVDALLDWGI